MGKMTRRLLRLGLVVLLPAVLLAHDTWLVPSKFHLSPGATVLVRLATSEAFPTSDGAVTPERVARFTLHTKAGTQPVKDYRVDGNYLLAEVAPQEEGHAIMVAETKPHAFVLEPKVFNDYLREEELKPMIEARRKAGKTNTPGRERYRKIAKTILCVGETRDTLYNKPQGLWVEIVPESSPCDLRVGNRLTVRVLLDGKPLPGVHLAAGYEGVTGHTYPIWVKTPQSGRVRITFDRPGLWFVRTLYMTPAKDDPEADWHSAFSTLTFEVQP